MSFILVRCMTTYATINNSSIEVGFVLGNMCIITLTCAHAYNICAESCCNMRHTAMHCRFASLLHVLLPIRRTQFTKTCRIVTQTIAMHIMCNAVNTPHQQTNKITQKHNHNSKMNSCSTPTPLMHSV